MTDTPRLYTTPVGRHVQGSLTDKNTTDYQGKPLPPEKHSYYFGIAIPKNAPGAAELVNEVITFAWNGYGAKAPHVQQQIAAVAADMNSNLFSLKIEDGDTNPKLAQNPAMRGCWLFKFGSMYAPKVCDTSNVQMDPAAVKRGYYVRVSFTMDINGKTDATAGIYLNPSWVQFVAFGEEIVSGPSAQQAFANAPAIQLPPGASPTPVAPAGGMPGSVPATMPPAVPYGAPVPPPAAPAAPTPPVQYGAPMPPPGGAPAGYTYPPTAAPGVPPMNAAPTGYPISPAVPPHPGILSGPPRIGG